MNVMEASFEFEGVRIQGLGEHLIRIEQQGPKGFEDRETFTVRHRDVQALKTEAVRKRTGGTVEFGNWRIWIPENPRGLEGIRVETKAGETLAVLSNTVPALPDLPSPSSLPAVWMLADHPRIVPPEQGALPPPPGGEARPDSGWDRSNPATDVYVFFPAASGYEGFRRDYLALTGRIPLVPLFALGLWYSRYYPYGEEEALAVIDRFRSEGFPLDVFVVDTDWRVGASSGYAVNETLFPDMARFARRAHERNVRIMLNDHPEPKGASALDPEELRHRRDGLVSLLEKGVDLWWFDRNWHTHLQAPAPGLNKEVWGMRLYHDIVRDFAPERRPLILSNADGIDNGWRRAPSHPACHRFPVWWTGDTRASWLYLRGGVENSVESGIRSLTPYVHEDLGGHHDQPDRELYVRFLQFGAFSPVARIHCTAGVHRYPWEYGEEAMRIVGGYFRLRYRLLPMLYAAAVEAHRSGLPLLRRCDLEWPGHPEAVDGTQYLLGDDLLVAPILGPAGEDGYSGRQVWIPPGDWEDAWSGRIHRGPAVVGVRCALHEYPVFLRRGGVVLTVPEREFTGEALWPELVADAYVPLRDGLATRTLHEDDGWSAAREQGKAAATDVTLRRCDGEIRLDLRPASGDETLRPARRTCTVRFHLPPGTMASGVSMNGKSLDDREIKCLTPSERRLGTLFEGPGSPPPPENGPVMEWQGDMDSRQPLRMSIEIERA